MEIVWDGIVHYRRPNDHPDLIEIQKEIEKQKRLYGKSMYSIRIWFKGNKKK